MLILGASDVRAVLDGGERAVVDAVDAAYRAHAQGRTQVPQSVFLRFPGGGRERIIALPAYLGGDTETCGMKWVSSFPGNLGNGKPRASAVMVLNSPHTGVPEVVLEASAISARRTAASAALAAATLSSSGPETGVTLVGCGPINFEVLRYLRTVVPSVDTVTLSDLDPERARSFAAAARSAWPDLKVDVAGDVADALGRHRLVSLATTATTPHLGTDHCRPGTLVLHLSLRDLTTDAIRSAVNVVDDVDHVCRAATSLHLTEQETGHRDFITATIGDLLVAGTRYVRRDDAVTVFSPFGLGCLDLAVAALVRDAASDRGLGTAVPRFLPTAQQVFA